MNKMITAKNIANFNYRQKINLMIVAVSISATLSSGLYAQNAGTVQPLGEAQAKKFYSSTIDDNNNVWFLTEKGIVSFDGQKWTSHSNPNIAANGLKSVAYDNSSLLLATPKGAAVATIPLSQGSAVKSFSPENSKILGENVLAIAAGKKDLKWFGTDKGISAVKGDKWLTNSYDNNYPESIFDIVTITSMATTLNGDSLFVGTKGGGVMRVYRDSEADAVTGASEYLAWGPILMPSDSVYCVHVSADGVQWMGTDKGIARHKGFKTLEGWTVFTKEDGLIDDFVQAISSDSKGNIYFGTKNGLSVFNGSTWKSIKESDGLAGKNILSLSVDKKDVVWVGTDNGVTSITGEKLVSYR